MKAGRCLLGSCVSVQSCGVLTSASRGVHGYMRRRWSERLPTAERGLPVVWGPRTHARAAAPMIGVGTGVVGVAALGCSSDTDPEFLEVLGKEKKDYWEVLEGVAVEGAVSLLRASA